MPVKATTKPMMVRGMADTLDTLRPPGFDPAQA
jgi:hypothetical protein